MTDTTHEAPELLPCPFCGSGPAIERQTAPFGVQLLHDFSSELHFVNCGKCGAKCGWGETKDQAIAAWNTRADLVQAAVAAERDRCARVAEAYSRSEHIAEDMEAGIFPQSTTVPHYIAAAIREGGS